MYISKRILKGGAGIANESHRSIGCGGVWRTHRHKGPNAPIPFRSVRNLKTNQCDIWVHYVYFIENGYPRVGGWTKTAVGAQCALNVIRLEGSSWTQSLWTRPGVWDVLQDKNSQAWKWIRITWSGPKTDSGSFQTQLKAICLPLFSQQSPQILEGPWSSCPNFLHLECSHAYWPLPHFSPDKLLFALILNTNDSELMPGHSTGGSLLVLRIKAGFEQVVDFSGFLTNCIYIVR